MCFCFAFETLSHLCLLLHFRHVIVFSFFSAEHYMGKPHFVFVASGYQFWAVRTQSNLLLNVKAANAGHTQPPC